MHERPDVPFDRAAGRDLCLDIYSPAASGNQRTAVLLYHGGGWRRGSRKSMEKRARLLQAQGFTAIPAEYRLLDEAPWPAPLHDVKAAIRWVRASAADLAIDPGRVVLAGYSAGAHLSLMAAGTANDPAWDGEGAPATDASVAAVAAFFPPVLLHAGDAQERGSSPAANLLGPHATPEEARRASPLSHVSAAFPPVLFIHGGADRVVSASSSIVMYDALRAAGVECDLHVYAGQNHEFVQVDEFGEITAREMALFFRRTVSQKEEIARRIEEQNPFARRAAEAAAAKGTP